VLVAAKYRKYESGLFELKRGYAGKDLFLNGSYSLKRSFLPLPLFLKEGGREGVWITSSVGF
jgi:hypothetical protein